MARWTAGTVFDLRRWSNGDAVVGRVLLPLIDIISDVDMIVAIFSVTRSRSRRSHVAKIFIKRSAGSARS